jgi:hypothetical protein
VKRIIYGLLVGILIMGLFGCDQAQQALDTIDKAKAFKNDFEKKAKDIQDKARELIPGSTQKNSNRQEDKGNEKDE